MKEQTTQKTLKQLFFPIFGETLLFMLAGTVDTLMLSGIGDEKVGAVGASNTYLSLLIMAFSIISNGMMAIMTQYIGAGKVGVARQARRIGILFNGGIGLFFSLLLLCFTRPVLAFLGIAGGLLPHAAAYMRIVGGSCFITAVIPIFTSYLKAFGYVKEPLAANIISNGVNILCNALFLYVFHWGVAGVAWATALSRLSSLAILIAAGQKKIRLPKEASGISTRQICGDILRIGFPSALETGLYNLAMAFIMTFVNRMSADGIYVTAKSYAAQIVNFSCCSSVAFANANAVMAGWRIGEGNLAECRQATFRVAKTGILVSVAISSLIAVCGSHIMRIFTEDETIIRLVCQVLVIDILLEIGKTSNLVFGSALKISGDAFFTVSIAVVFMYLLAVGGTYFFGLTLGWHLAGSWIALALDECARAVLMGLRWKSNRWHKKILVKTAPK